MPNTNIETVAIVAIETEITITAMAEVRWKI